MAWEKKRPGLSIEAEIRKRRINMSTLGMGVIAFGVWSILKTYLYLWVDAMPLEMPDIPPEMMGVMKVVLYVLLTVILLIDLGLRLYLGLSARAVGMGRRRGRTYIIIAALLLAGNVLGWGFMLFSTTGGKMENQSTMDFCVSLLVDFSATAMLAELLYNAARLRKLEQAKEG